MAKAELELLQSLQRQYSLKETEDFRNNWDIRKEMGN